ncbi:MAG: serine/threonine protein kinase, partial [Terriglobales bacterium]
VCPEDGFQLAPLIFEALIGTVIAERYEIVSFIGMGGWSQVYKGKHLTLNRFVAIKILHEHMAQDPAKIQRFQQEARAQSSLTHPNIATVFDSGLMPNGQPYLVMDFLDGLTLDEIVTQSGRLSTQRALPIFIQAASALQAAHQKGFVHRDLKPANIMILSADKVTGGDTKQNPFASAMKETAQAPLSPTADTDDVVKILDFGLARMMEQDSREAMRLTQSGDIIGTPAYMSPEQCLGKKADGRSDIYLFGCVMYEVVSGMPAISGSSAYECMHMHLNDMPEPLAKVVPDLNVPPDLERVVFRCLEKKPEDRYQSMAEVFGDLTAVNANVALPSVRAGAR